jgi:hypothetical protein
MHCNQGVRPVMATEIHAGLHRLSLLARCGVAPVARNCFLGLPPGLRATCPCSPSSLLAIVSWEAAKWRSPTENR